MNDIIVRQVSVDRSRTPLQMIQATGRKQRLKDNALSTVPRYVGGEVTVCFFQLRRDATPREIELMYKSHRLMPDPYAQAAVHEADAAFADEYRNVCLWNVDPSGYFCCSLTFFVSAGERCVTVHNNKEPGAILTWWNPGMWFAGVKY